ncbi:MAG TPA: hypothetical protein VFC66_04460 [Anaerolineaceae bacterium]|nr:hypothetical protein [Anaerolineaceae bacterium]
MNSEEPLKFLRHWLLLLGGACIWFLLETWEERNIWFMAMAVMVLICAVLFCLTWRLKPGFLYKVAFLKNDTGSWIALSLTALVLTLLFFNLPFYLFSYGIGRFAFAIGFSGIFALILSGKTQTSFHFSFAGWLLVFGVLHRVAAFVPEIQSGPFSLGWSEGSRFYNASLFAPKYLYGLRLPLPALPPSRYLMQALPFYFGIRSILFHRIWQVVLWLGMTLWGSWLMAKRLDTSAKVPLPWLTALLFLFFFQGAVYYHLMVCVVLVLAGYKKDEPLRTLIFVLLASVWAGISRVNWMPVPGLMAVALYLLDVPFDGKKWVKYLLWPATWVIGGLAVAYLSRQGYIAISAEDPTLFDSAFSSALLWWRLWPNDTFSLGIVTAMLLVMLPGVALLWLKLREKSLPRLHLLQWLGLAGILGVFLAGGLVVSVKIGGGGDLHNLDGFLVFWVLIVGGILATSLRSQQPNGPLAEKQPWRFWLVMVVTIPVLFAFMRAGFWSFGDVQSQDAELNDLKRAIGVLQDQGGDVLFISERQLLTFGELDLPVVPEYEKLFLMEMAMSNNQEYLKQFRQKLKSHAFIAIVSDPLSTNIQGSDRSFADENNTWVEQVVFPMLAEYESVLSWCNGEVNLLVPQGEKELILQLLESQVPAN